MSWLCGKRLSSLTSSSNNGFIFTPPRSQSKSACIYSLISLLLISSIELIYQPQFQDMRKSRIDWIRPYCLVYTCCRAFRFRRLIDVVFLFRLESSFHGEKELWCWWVLFPCFYQFFCSSVFLSCFLYHVCFFFQMLVGSLIYRMSSKMKRRKFLIWKRRPIPIEIGWIKFIKLDAAFFFQLFVCCFLPLKR